MTKQIELIISNTNKILLNYTMQGEFYTINVKSLIYFN